MAVLFVKGDKYQSFEMELPIEAHWGGVAEKEELFEWGMVTT